MLDEGSSDLHITAGSPPAIRLDGQMVKLDLPVMTPADTEELVRGIAKDEQIKQLYENGGVGFRADLPRGRAFPRQPVPATGFHRHGGAADPATHPRHGARSGCRRRCTN